MNYVLGNLIDKGVIVYIDNILIHTETDEEYTKLVMKVLQLLSDVALCISLEKLVVHIQQVEFLGYMISVHGATMSDKAVKQNIHWKTSNKLNTIQRVLASA